MDDQNKLLSFLESKIFVLLSIAANGAEAGTWSQWTS